MTTATTPRAVPATVRVVLFALDGTVTVPAVPDTLTTWQHLVAGVDRHEAIHRQRGVDDAAAGRPPGTRHRPSHGDRGCPRAPASAGLCVQAAHLKPEAQVDRTSRVGKKHLRVEVLLAAAASPEPPPIDELMPDPLLHDELPEDLPWLLRLLPRADVYLQDEVEVALHPTLTRGLVPQGTSRPAAGRGAGHQRQGIRLRPG